jgi:sodium/potassium-transporting ATPase subunit alpha
MGGGSSDAAKQVSDIVLLDNNLGSIIAGIEEGRLMFENLRKSTAFALSSNFAEILPFLFLMIFRIPTPLNPMGILMISMGSDLVREY